MATITIDNSVVVRIIEGYGFEVKEQVQTFSGETIDRYYTIWNKEVSVKVGDTVKAQGDHSVKVDSYTGSDNIPKTRAQVSVNNAKVKLLDEDLPF